MTTLEQILEEYGIDKEYDIHFKNIAKKWLQQKLTEVELEHKNIPSIVTYGTILYLKKLLEELNEEKKDVSKIEV